MADFTFSVRPVEIYKLEPPRMHVLPAFGFVFVDNENTTGANEPCSLVAEMSLF